MMESNLLPSANRADIQTIKPPAFTIISSDFGIYVVQFADNRPRYNHSRNESPAPGQKYTDSQY